MGSNPITRLVLVKRFDPSVFLAKNTGVSLGPFGHYALCPWQAVVVSLLCYIQNAVDRGLRGSWHDGGGGLRCLWAALQLNTEDRDFATQLTALRW